MRREDGALAFSLTVPLATLATPPDVAERAAPPATAGSKSVVEEATNAAFPHSETTQKL